MAYYERNIAASGADLETRPGGWNFSWSAVWAGVLGGLALLVFLILFGVAIGLSTIDPYEITRFENQSVWQAATIAWVVIASLGSIFAGAWLAGYLSRADRDSTLMHGPVVWALAVLLTTVAFGGMMQFFPSMANTAQSSPLTYSSLSDQQFTSFVLDHARNWRPGVEEEQPINVSADTLRRVDPGEVSENDNLLNFVQNNTNLTRPQARDFLQTERLAIAQAQAGAQRRWESAHAAALASANRVRKTGSAAAWTLTAIVFFSLAFSLLGAWVGYQTRGNGNEGRDYSREGHPLNEPAPEAYTEAPAAPVAPAPVSNPPPQM